MFESCIEIRNHYSDFLDGLCQPEALKSIRFHLTYCLACEAELARRQALRADLRGLARLQVPPELALRLRVSLSHHLHRNVLGRMVVRLDNFFRPLLLPATGGILTAMVCFGIFMGAGAPPVSHVPDVSFQVGTPPRVDKLMPMTFSNEDQAVVVVTTIDAGGRLKDYRLLSGRPSPELTHHLDRMLFFSRFAPATTLGKPTEGQMVLSLRRITVRG